jgi:hypothetical protein
MPSARRPSARSRHSAPDEAEGTILNDLLGPNPTVTATAIVNDGTLMPEARRR